MNRIAGLLHRCLARDADATWLKRAKELLSHHEAADADSIESAGGTGSAEARP